MGSHPSEFRRDFHALTGLRALAAFLVFLHHYPSQDQSSALLSVWSMITENFHIGVTIFFVLSGFLISWNYESDAKIQFSWLARYYQRRFARIYPVYFAVLVATLAITRDFSWKTGLMNAIFLPGYFNEYKILLAVAWTLAVEEVFYFLAPFIFVLRRSVPLAVIYLGVLAFGLGLLALGLHFGGWGYFSDPKQFWLRTFFGHSAEFFVGIYIAKFAHGHRHERLRPTFPWKTSVGLLVLLLAPYAIGKTGGLFTDGGILINNFALPIAIGFLLIGLANETSWVGRSLASRLGRILGRSSYAFYLIHYGYVAGVLIKYGSANRAVLFFTLVVTSTAFWWFYEEPLRQLISRARLTRVEEVEDFPVSTSEIATEISVLSFEEAA